jgi:hypothetical protein
MAILPETGTATPGANFHVARSHHYILPPARPEARFFAAIASKNRFDAEAGCQFLALRLIIADNRGNGD